MYYDRYGKGAIQKIDYGYGTIKPNNYGYKSPEKRRGEKYVEVKIMMSYWRPNKCTYP